MDGSETSPHCCPSAKPEVNEASPREDAVGSTNLDPSGQEEDRAEGLGDRFARAGVWLGGVHAMTRLIQFARLMILARLLSPRDFGYFGLCMVAVQAMKVLTKSGFWTAMLQRKGDVTPYFDTYFLVSVVRGAVLTGAVLVGAGPMAGIMGSPAAASLLRAVSLVFLIEGLSSPAMSLYWRSLHLKKECFYQLTGVLADLLVSVGAAIVLRNAWALVVGFVARDIALVIASYFLAPYRVRANWSFRYAQHLFQFGGWILGISVLVFLLEQGIVLYTGRVFGTAVLGFYVLAYQIGNRPTREFAVLLSRPVFVAFASLQDQKDRLRAAYLGAFQLIASLAIPAGVGIALLARSLVIIFPGEQWLNMVEVLRVLALWSMVQSLNTLGYALLKGVGRPEAEMRMRVGQTLIVALLLWPLSRALGLTGVGLSLLLGELAVAPFAFRRVGRLLDCRPWTHVRLLLYPALGAAVMAAAMTFGRVFLADPAEILGLLAMATLGAAGYLAAVAVMAKWFEYGLPRSIMQRVQNCCSGPIDLLARRMR